MACLQEALVVALLFCVSSRCHGQPMDSHVSPVDLDENPLQGKLHFPRWGLYTLVAVIAGAGVLIAFPMVAVWCVRMLGFAATGIVAGSWAAWIMSLYAGRVAVGSICAICQSIGALGVASLAVLWPILAVLWPILAIGVAILLLSLGIMECVRLGIFQSLGAQISEWWNTLVNSIHL